MTTDNEKKLFEEYRMELIYLGDDVITTSPVKESPDVDVTDPWDGGDDQGWGEEPSFE